MRGAGFLKRLLGIARPAQLHPAPAVPAEIFLQNAVIVRFSGGLANQMLCYKLLRYLADMKGAAAIIDATTYGGTANDSARNFQLHKYPIKYDLLVFSLETMRSILESNAVAPITKADLDAYPPGDETVIERINRESIVVCDLWLSLRLRHAIDVAAEENGALRELTLIPEQHFSADDMDCLEWIRSTKEPVAIHVRRGDFATHDGNLLLTAEYYNRAIERAESELADPRFLVISDDIPWCRKNLRAQSELRFVDFHSDRDAYKDMFLASQCRHFILSNESTFSHQLVQLSPRFENRIVITSSMNDLVRNQPKASPSH